MPPPVLGGTPKKALVLLSDPARRLLAAAVPSVWALEALLYLKKSAPQNVTVDDLTRELRARRGLVEDILSGLKKHGLVGEEEGRFAYQPASSEAAALVAEIEAAYSRTPMALVKLIVDTPNEKIRSFADAFKIKRDEP